MIIRGICVKLYAPFCRSLKDKRAVVQSIVSKVKNKYNVSISEIDEMDKYQVIVLGIAFVSNSKRHADSVLSQVLNYIESITQTQVMEVLYE